MPEEGDFIGGEAVGLVDKVAQLVFEGQGFGGQGAGEGSSSASSRDSSLSQLKVSRLKCGFTLRGPDDHRKPAVISDVPFSPVRGAWGRGKVARSLCERGAGHGVPGLLCGGLKY